MSNKAHFLDVTLLGKEYRVACPQDEYDALLAAVDYVNNKFNETVERTQSTMSERTAVMAALNIAHEHLLLKKSVGLSDTEKRQEKIVDISELSRRIKSMEDQLDSVLDPQDQPQ